MNSDQTMARAGLLGDTPERDYSSKLRRFSAFAEPELRQCIASLGLRPGMRVLDAGCDTGENLVWLAGQIQPGGEVVGIDLAAAHVAAARLTAPAARIIQADLREPPLSAGEFDLVWCANTINHVKDPAAALRVLLDLLKPDGRIALAQSSLLPEMFFAWDLRLERLTNEAVRQYYGDRYGLNERDLTGIRSIFGLLRAANLKDVRVRTVLLERCAPLDAAAEAYISEAIFRDTWGDRLQPYLDPADSRELRRLTDPDEPGFAPRRPDFHFLQTFTLATGNARERPA
jgi:SAM-dependent methyltransferase